MRTWEQQKQLYPKWTDKREHYAKLFGTDIEVRRPKAKDIIERVAFSLAGSALGFAVLAIVVWIVA